MPRLLCLLPLLFLGFLPQQPDAKPVSLFDGKSFDGWDGDTKEIWRIEDGCLVGGSLTKTIKVNHFLATKKSYANFVLKLQFKLLGDTKKGFVNSGIQIRSQRDPKSTEMIGYQCDLGDPTWWGSIYDESRRNKLMAQSDMAALNKVLKRGDWNEYLIRAEGNRIRTWINGVQGVDYTEADDEIVQEGRIGIQIHSGGPAEIWVKDITIEELPATPSKPKFKGSDNPPPPPHPSPLTPQEELKTFSLPPGFTIELVASEPDVGKPITVAWDHAGRMWTMTALEYPVDANEEPERSRALFANGGRDKVLVFDNPYGPGPHKPRVFADGLAIPLGLLPYKDGAYVQYGNKILFLRDTKGTGKADTRETILSDFGTEDSHLFVHQFTRGPGGWIYMAQGAFNHSRVKTKEGPVVRMDFCKMARWQPDGSRFELVECGLNNIWGFVIDRQGEMFIQEANDLGYPVVPFFIGANYPGIGNEKLKPYAPWQPALANHFQMGGTGLSGLALAEDKNNWPEPYANVMYVANPITRKVQAIRILPDGPHHRLQKLPDFLQCSDEWFRPVSIHFGPDGCLYVVDWYNKIISHNEVPRNHPDRDKTRGRIWRIRHKDQPQRTVPDLTKVKDAELLKHLAADNTWEGKAAWMEIVDRKAVGLRAELEKIVVDKRRPTDERLRALWAMEGLQEVPDRIFLPLLSEPSRNIRREVVRVLRTFPHDANRLVPTRLAVYIGDRDPQVRAEVIRLIGDLAETSPDRLYLLFAMVANGPVKSAATVNLQQGGKAYIGTAHDQEFERYLIRATFERHSEAVARLIDSVPKTDFWLEGRLLAALVLEPKTSAQRLAKMLPQAKRPPNEEELLRLVEFAQEPDIAAMLPKLLERRETLQTLLALRTRFDAAKLNPQLTAAARKLWKGDDAGQKLALQLILAFKLSALEEELAAVLTAKASLERQLTALRALREMASAKAELFFTLAKDAEAGSPLREEAVLTLASSPAPQAAELFVKLLPNLSARERRLGIDRLVNNKPGALAVVKALRSGAIPEEFLDAPLVEKLQIVLGNDAELTSLLESHATLFRSVLVLNRRPKSYVEEPITLSGPFTVETWIRLEPGISNADSMLGAPGVADLNFHDSRPRFWAGRHGDVIIAKRQVAPHAWTHVALTRDAQGRFALYINGELDTNQSRPLTETFSNLSIGRSNPPQGTAAAFTEYRVWNYARSPEQIREMFDHALEGQPLPSGLVKYFPGAGPWGKLHGNARVTRTMDFPPLMTATEAKAFSEKFAKYKALAQEKGEVTRGKEVFAKNCLNCHSVQGHGGQIGPTLSGAGATGDDALLRNLLTPSAAIEPGYRLFRIEMRNGTLKEGFLVNQTNEYLLLRREKVEDERIPQKDVLRAEYTRRSVMPDGQ
jgi:putative membrane-bound dehydrogenase-like protein